jgi:hypothetical protein
VSKFRHGVGLSSVAWVPYIICGVGIVKAQMPNWSRMDTTATGKKSKIPFFYVHCNLFVETGEYSFIILL